MMNNWHNNNKKMRFYKILNKIRREIVLFYKKEIPEEREVRSQN